MEYIFLMIVGLATLVYGVVLLNSEQYKKLGSFLSIMSVGAIIISILVMIQVHKWSDIEKTQERTDESSLTTSTDDENSEDAAETESSSTESSTSSIDEDATDGFDSNYALEDFIQENTSYSDVSVKGTYVADPYTCVITIKDTHDFRVVVSDVLEAFHDHADDKLNKFDEINIQVKNDSQTLKTSYPVSTVMYDSGVYRPSKVEGLATQWIIR